MKPLTADYLKRSEALEFRMSNMKETLFNQITAEEFDLISGLGKGEIKIPRYFFLAETEEFEPGNQYTIYTHTYNGIKRNGYHFYTQLEEGDNIIFIIERKINLSLELEKYQSIFMKTTNSW